MSKVKFTPEQQQMLRENPYTIHMTADVLSISKEFKEIFYIARNTASECPGRSLGGRSEQTPEPRKKDIGTMLTGSRWSGFSAWTSAATARGLS